MSARSDKLLELDALRKSYGTVEVLHGVTLSIHPGEVLGLIGENGAGKSTLVKCLNGMERPSAGTILWEGRPFAPRGAAEGIRAGIVTIPQEFNLVNDLSVAENIFLGQEPLNRLGLIDTRLMRQQARELLSAFGAERMLDVDSLVGELSVAGKQMVEIEKAVRQSCRLLIMDEPTTVLNQSEIDILFDIIERLKRAGTSVIFISHKLREVLRICDSIAVLRDGELVSFGPASGLDEAELARRMVGRAPSQMFLGKAQPPAKPTPALEVNGLCVPGLLHDVSFSIARGEILGFAGLVGAGRTELAECIYGIRRPSCGTVSVLGKRLPLHHTPRSSVDAGLSYLPEDRQGTGIITSFPLAYNITLSSLRKYCHPFVSEKEEAKRTTSYIDAFAIKTRNPWTRLSDLSGGNQQKAAIAKGLDTGPGVFIFDEPTRGIDINAKSEVYGFIRNLLVKGVACMFISSDMEEVIAVCPRIAVMREGRIAGFLTGSDISEENIMYLATGVKTKTAAHQEDTPK